MKRFVLLSFLFVSLAFLNSGCGLGEATKKAGLYADKFHGHLMKKNIDGMMTMVHEQAMGTEEEAFRELFTRMTEELNVKEVEEGTGFNTSINNGIATVYSSIS